MKTRQLILPLFLLLLTAYSYAQQTATLQCNIEALEAGEEPADVCFFTEAPDESPVDFTIEAYLDEEITWSGVGEIKIHKIQWKNGTKIFNGRDPKGNANGRAKDKPKKVTPGDDPYVYTLVFKVKGDKYEIDPIIKVKNR